MIRLIVLLSSLLALTGCSGSSEVMRPYISDLGRIENGKAHPDEKIPLLKALHERAMGQGRAIGIKHLVDSDLKSLREINSALNFYAAEHASVEDTRTIFEELEMRRMDSAAARQELIDNYVAAREFERADEFWKLSPHLALRKPPMFRDASGTSTPRTLLRVSGGGTVLTRHDYSLDGESRIVVLSSPNCGFSQMAAKSISDDADISQIMKRESVWIVSQQEAATLPAIEAWNVKYPALHMELAYKNSEWPEAARWQSPSFLIYKNGKLASVIVGWPGDEQKTRLRAALGQSGSE